jgi:hypothetical protein
MVNNWTTENQSKSNFKTIVDLINTNTYQGLPATNSSVILSHIRPTVFQYLTDIPDDLKDTVVDGKFKPNKKLNTILTTHIINKLDKHHRKEGIGTHVQRVFDYKTCIDLILKKDLKKITVTILQKEFPELKATPAGFKDKRQWEDAIRDNIVRKVITIMYTNNTTNNDKKMSPYPHQPPGTPATATATATAPSSGVHSSHGSFVSSAFTTPQRTQRTQRSHQMMSGADSNRMTPRDAVDAAREDRIVYSQAIGAAERACHDSISLIKELKDEMAINTKYIQQAINDENTQNENLPAGAGRGLFHQDYNVSTGVAGNVRTPEEQIDPIPYDSTTAAATSSSAARPRFNFGCAPVEATATKTVPDLSKGAAASGSVARPPFSFGCTPAVTTNNNAGPDFNKGNTSTIFGVASGGSKATQGFIFGGAPLSASDNNVPVSSTGPSLRSATSAHFPSAPSSTKSSSVASGGIKATQGFIFGGAPLSASDNNVPVSSTGFGSRSATSAHFPSAPSSTKSSSVASGGSKVTQGFIFGGAPLSASDNNVPVSSTGPSLRSATSAHCPSAPAPSTKSSSRPTKRKAGSMHRPSVRTVGRNDLDDDDDDD